MVKNCGDFVHFQIAEKNVLGEMVKIVKKKTDMHVRDKILVLLDSWQEAFGGPGGKHPQYYWAYEELRHSGVEFPQRSQDAAPIFTPPVTNPTLRHAQPGYGMPSNSSRRLDETMAAEIEGLSLSSLGSMRDVMELLGDMLQAVNPVDREAVKDEVILDLVNRCRSNQKKLMQMLTATGDEELLGKGLELNDSLQILLAKHDAIACGSPMPAQVTRLSPKPCEGCPSDIKPSEERDGSPVSASNSTAPVANVSRSAIDEEDEEEDDFAQLARRHSKTQSCPSQSSDGTSGAIVLMDTSVPGPSISAPCNALALPDPPALLKTTKEQDMIDFLSLTLATTSTSSHSPRTSVSNQSTPQIPVSSSLEGYSYTSQTYSANPGPVPYNSYVVPWAQPQTQQCQLQPPSQPQVQPQSHQQFYPASQPQPQPQQLQPQLQPQSVTQAQENFQPGLQPQSQHEFQLQLQSQHPQCISGYPPPPWAATPGYLNSQNHTSAGSTARANIVASHTLLHTARPLQQSNSFSTRAGNESAMNGNPWISYAPRIPAAGYKQPFIPSYRLFEDLNVLENVDGRFKMSSSTSPSLSGTSGQSMGGRK